MPELQRLSLITVKGFSTEIHPSAYRKDARVCYRGVTGGAEIAFQSLELNDEFFKDQVLVWRDGPDGDASAMSKSDFEIFCNASQAREEHSQASDLSIGRATC